MGGKQTFRAHVDHTGPAGCAEGEGLELGTEFCSEKIPRNRLGTVSIIPRKKASFRGIPSSVEEPIPKL